MQTTAQLLSFNHAVALDRVGGDEELLREVAQLYLDEYQELLLEISAAVTARSADRLQRSAHTLKGSLGTLGAEQAASYALALETMGRIQNLNGAERALSGLQQTLNGFHRELSQLV